MRIEPTALPGVLQVLPVRHGDHRGFFSEVFHAGRFAEAGLTGPWVQDNHSLTAQVGTVRGLHFQTPPHAQGKLVRVIRGAILDVAVDLRHGSPTFGRHVAVELSVEKWNQLWVPPGFAHGFCSLVPEVEVLYKVTAHYAPAHDAGVRWDDPDLAIPWPVAPGSAVLSAKDAALPRLRDLPPTFRYEP
jgi:dTDP-4-dehydrorhamnose 3,5-epimerase